MVKPATAPATKTSGHEIPEVSKGDWLSAPTQYCKGDTPYVVKGLVSDWPSVANSTEDRFHCARYLLTRCADVNVDVLESAPETGGRIFYNEDMSGFNFTRCRRPLAEVLDALSGTLDGHCYVGSSTVDLCLPGFRKENDLPLGSLSPLVSIWLGNQTRIAAHFDAPDNLACVVAGRRRFTLFPPHQVENLYVGPLDLTPAGQAISLVDFDAPDFARFPRFTQAMENAWVAELEAGDAIFIPSLWWHHVASLSDFNVLVNYWWQLAPAVLGAPMDVLMHGLLSLRQLPEAQRKGWQALFAHYVFNASPEEHIPTDSKGILKELDDDLARQLRAMVSNRLRR